MLNQTIICKNCSWVLTEIKDRDFNTYRLLFNIKKDQFSAVLAEKNGGSIFEMLVSIGNYQIRIR
ncbi:hypothetical protein MMU07_15425 [Aquiflexum sp. LQ15W]|uniref:hypothetical protein n=1 Tax=Cognataquiflexum nitidum TaxID=2922272 RepID=UPI001F13F6C4|nr:hypothetical protein [Cognataquiflexum nitidum]MCH6200976.1 hypothetical protein [Cognataquiflexum nitidum]